MKRLFFALLGFMLVVSPAGIASAGPGQSGGSGGGGAPDTETAAIAFTIPARQCPNLAPATVINGSGTSVSRTHTTVQHGMITTFNVTRAVGTATDAAGNEYRFVYRNTMRVSGAGASFTGLMTDSFRLHGGPEPLSNGFEALVTSTGPTAEDVTGFTDVLSEYGNPYDFTNFAPLCDPL